MLRKELVVEELVVAAWWCEYTQYEYRSLGASCIAYIAPGLAYIRANGGRFLQWVKGKASEAIDPTVGTPKDTELPIVGDATARTPTDANVGNSTIKLFQ